MPLSPPRLSPLPIGSPQAHQSSLRQSEELQQGQDNTNSTVPIKATSDLLLCSLWPELCKAEEQRKRERKRQHLPLKIDPRRFALTRASSSELCSSFCRCSLAQFLGDRVLGVEARASARSLEEPPGRSGTKSMFTATCAAAGSPVLPVCAEGAGSRGLAPGFSHLCLLLSSWDLRDICGSTALTYTGEENNQYRA